MIETMFLSLLILIVGLILRNAIYNIKQSNIKEKNVYEVCNYLNTHKIYIRDKDCTIHKYKTHVVSHYPEKSDYSIVIDIY